MTNSHIIFLKGKDKTHEIAQCTLKDDMLCVRFKNNSKIFTYKKPHFALFPKATTSNVFAYLKQLSQTIRIKSDGNESLSILAKAYDTITFIPKDCVLSTYLNPPKATAQNPPTSPHESKAKTRQAQASTTKALESKSNLAKLSPTRSHLHNIIPPNTTILAPFGLNLSQCQALQNTLSHHISVIEGPPGTGKTQTILNLIANLLYRGKTIAVLSNNNAATQNVYEKLSSYGFENLCATLGKKENKQNFIANQNPQSLEIFTSLATQNLSSKKTEHILQESHQKLQDIFTLQT